MDKKAIEKNGNCFDVNDFIQFDFIKFTNGYGKNRPFMIIENKGISIDLGKTEWGADENTLYFVIKLGKLTNAFFLNYKN